MTLSMLGGMEGFFGRTLKLRLPARAPDGDHFTTSS
jgi:hypothetical protein